MISCHINMNYQCLFRFDAWLHKLIEMETERSQLRVKNRSFHKVHWIFFFFHRICRTCRKRIVIPNEISEHRRHTHMSCFFFVSFVIWLDCNRQRLCVNFLFVVCICKMFPIRLINNLVLRVFFRFPLNLHSRFFRFSFL